MIALTYFSRVSSFKFIDLLSSLPKAADQIMASSSISYRRRNVTFTNRPPQIVRYSYHAGPDASTSLQFGTSAAIGKYSPMISHEPTYQNTNDTSSSVSSSPPIYDNVPKTFTDIPPRRPRVLPKPLVSHRWTNNDGIERVDVIQRHSGVTHVNINGGFDEDDDDEG